MNKMEGLKPIKAVSVPRRSIDEEGDEALSPGARLFSDPDFNMYGLFIITFKTPINLTVFKTLMTPLLQHPRFSSLLQPGANGKFKWVRTTQAVDINAHVIVPELETDDGVSSSTEEVVNGYISGLSNSGAMDMSRPMWEWHVLNIKSSDDAESTVVLRLHHSIGDATSLMSLLLSLAGQCSKPPPADHIEVGKQMNLNYMRLVGQMVLNTWASSVMFLMTLFLNKRDTETPLGPNPTTCSRTKDTGGGKSHKFVRKTISLDDVKVVKHAINGTINDVMLGVVQAGVFRYLRRKKTYGNYATNRNNNTNESWPQNMRLRAAVTMNLRPSSRIPELSEMMKVNSKVKWGNKIAFVMVPLNTKIEKGDELDYVRESKTSMDKKKLSFEPKLSYIWTKFHPSMVPKVGGKITLGFSNVQGPSTEITLFGHQVTNIFPSVYGNYPLALVIHVGSYGKKMNIVCSVDNSVISDPHQLCEDLEQAFDIIKMSVMVQSKL